MSVTDSSQKALVDVRHVARDENVACQAGECQERWAKYVVECDINPRTLQRKPVRTYLCWKCAMKLLTLADSVGEG
jgi:hypothetical protein